MTNAASQSVNALSMIVSQSRPRSPGESLMACNTSVNATCCACNSSRSEIAASSCCFSVAIVGSLATPGPVVIRTSPGRVYSPCASCSFSLTAPSTLATSVGQREGSFHHYRRNLAISPLAARSACWLYPSVPPDEYGFPEDFEGQTRGVRSPRKGGYSSTLRYGCRVECTVSKDTSQWYH